MEITIDGRSDSKDYVAVIEALKSCGFYGIIQVGIDCRNTYNAADQKSDPPSPMPTAMTAFTLPEGVYSIECFNPVSNEFSRIGFLDNPADRVYRYDVHTLAYKDPDGNPHDVHIGIAEVLTNDPLVIQIKSQTPYEFSDDASTDEFGQTTYAISRVDEASATAD